MGPAEVEQAGGHCQDEGEVSGHCISSLPKELNLDLAGFGGGVPPGKPGLSRELCRQQVEMERGSNTGESVELGFGVEGLGVR